MKGLFNEAGFSDDQASHLVTHLAQSGALSKEFLGALFEHIETREPEREKLTQIQKIRLGLAAENSKTEGGIFSPEKFFENTASIPPEYLLAIIQAGHQRYFSNQVVVSLQEPTYYSEEYQEDIAASARLMGMTQERRVNPNGGDRERVDIGICIGATSKTVQGYLENQHRILTNRINGSDPYSLYLLLGNRKLCSIGSDGNEKSTESDNPKSSTPGFTYNDIGADGNRRDYLGYLSDKYQVPRGNLTETHAVKDRFEIVYGKTLEQAVGEGFLKPIEAPNAEIFFNKIANELKGFEPASDPRTLVVTTVQPFNRRYETMMMASLEKAEAAGFDIKSDGGSGAATQQPQTIMREFAVMINVMYPLIAKRCGVENPINSELLNNNQVQLIEAKIASQREEEQKGRK